MSCLLFSLNRAPQDIAGDFMKEETVLDEQCCKEKQPEVHSFISTITKLKHKTKQKTSACFYIFDLEQTHID